MDVRWPQKLVVPIWGSLFTSYISWDRARAPTIRPEIANERQWVLRTEHCGQLTPTQEICERWRLLDKLLLGLLESVIIVKRFPQRDRDNIMPRAQTTPRRKSSRHPKISAADWFFAQEILAGWFRRKAADPRVLWNAKLQTGFYFWMILPLLGQRFWVALTPLPLLRFVSGEVFIVLSKSVHQWRYWAYLLSAVTRMLW